MSIGAAEADGLSSLFPYPWLILCFVGVAACLTLTYVLLSCERGGAPSAPAGWPSAAAAGGAGSEQAAQRGGERPADATGSARVKSQ